MEIQQIPIIPNGKRYWVLAPKQEQKTHEIGSYKLVENAEKAPPLQGRVVAVGDAIEYFPSSQETPGGRRSICKFRRGNLVIFGAYAGNRHTWDGIDYLILHEDEILGHIIETPFDERDTTDLTQQ